MPAPPPTPGLSLLMRIEVEVEQVYDLGMTDAGHRRIVTLKGGRVRGEALSGTVRPGGADWQVELADGSVKMEARYIVQSDDGSVLSVHVNGLRTGEAEVLGRLADGADVDPASYYYRTAISFETSAPAHRWLARTLTVGVVARRPTSVSIDVYAVT